jgi:Bromodomain associated
MKRISIDAVERQHEKAYRDDMIYCHGTARRAVARAALHLGIECMTAESIDVLASCLLDYLERIGAMMANNAEAAGRSSAHCNVYDAINAIELCTCTAAATTKSTNSLNGASNLDTIDATDSRMDSFNKVNLNNGTSWKDLASFCFGPNWNTNPSSTVDTLHPFNQQANGGMNTAAGGKTGPAAMLMMNGSTPSLAAEAGWNAPYPDEIEHFPVVTKRGQVANPHPFPEPKLHRRDISVQESSSHMTLTDGNEAEKTNEVLSNIPDSVYRNQTVWGDVTESKQSSVSTGEKRPLEPMQDDETKPPPTKKVKLMEGSSTAQEHIDPLFDALLLPTFYPPIPKPHNDDNRIIVTDGKISTDSKKSLSSSKSTVARVADKISNEWDHNDPTRLLVRSALVGRNLGNSSSRNVTSSLFWGSSWSTIANRTIDLVVPAGRPSSVTGLGTSATEGSSSGAASTATNTALTAPSIVPIGRASGSRVSRILEGSMDPPIL